MAASRRFSSTSCLAVVFFGLLDFLFEAMNVDGIERAETVFVGCDLRLRERMRAFKASLPDARPCAIERRQHKPNESRREEAECKLHHRLDGNHQRTLGLLLLSRSSFTRLSTRSSMP